MASINHLNIRYYEKKILNSDGHQFHQCQQNEQLPLILTELTEHKKDHDI